MKPFLQRPSLLRCVLAALVVGVVGIFSGCATLDTGERGVSGVAPATAKVFTRVEMQVRTSSRYFGDEAYAEVNSAWLKPYYESFRAELFRLGIVKWDERFDCKRFAELYTGLAQANFYRYAFHSTTKA